VPRAISTASRKPMISSPTSAALAPANISASETASISSSGSSSTSSVLASSG